MAIKIVLIGSGAVGTSFLYAAINQGLAAEYVLIDAFPNAALGNALDLADTAATVPHPFSSVVAGTYADLKNADICVITAGRPQKKIIDPKTGEERLETRLEMVSGNAVIMADIATQVKKSGFKGITVIASNPVDVLTRVYQEVTGFAENTVIGSGTTLDSSRLRRLIGEKLNVNAQSVNAYIIGEHGDSSVAVWSNANINNKPISEYKISTKELAAIHQEAVKMAYKIIELKRATFYGIGCALARIVKAIINHENTILVVGAKLHGEYKTKDVYIGVPAVINKYGIVQIVQWKLDASEQAAFSASAKNLNENYKAAMKAISNVSIPKAATVKIPAPEKRPEVKPVTVQPAPAPAPKPVTKPITKQVAPRQATSQIDLDIKKVKIAPTLRPNATKRIEISKFNKIDVDRTKEIINVKKEPDLKEEVSEFKSKRVFNQDVIPLAPIVPILGSDEITTRSAVIKTVWKYIKKNGLQDRRTIYVKGLLEAIIPGETEIEMMQLAKYVNKQLKTHAKIVEKGDEKKVIALKDEKN